MTTTSRIKIDLSVKVNNVNSPYHGRKGKVLRYMGKVDAYDKQADCWEVQLGPCNFMVFRQNELMEWSKASLARDAAYVDSFDL